METKTVTLPPVALGGYGATLAEATTSQAYEEYTKQYNLVEDLARQLAYATARKEIAWQAVLAKTKALGARRPQKESQSLEEWGGLEEKA